VNCAVHAPTVVAVAWTRHRSRFTTAFEDTAVWLTAHTVAELLRTTWRAVSGTVTRVVADASALPDRAQPTGTLLEIWDCTSGNNQVWQPYNGSYRIPVSGRCLDDPAVAATDGTWLEFCDCNGTTA
jgi:hypothetical protein